MTIRDRLQTITEVMDLALHGPLLAELTAEIPHTVLLVQPADPENDFNCVMYALDLVGWVDPPTSALGRYFASTAFLRSLIEGGELQELQECAVDVLAVYLRGAEIRHIGRVCANGRIRSKWGAGHTYEHELWEVPSTYGDVIRYYASIESEASQALLEEYLG